MVLFNCTSHVWVAVMVGCYIIHMMSLEIISNGSRGFTSSPASMKIFFSFLIKGHKQTKDQEFEIKLVEENICISFLCRDEGEIER